MVDPFLRHFQSVSFTLSYVYIKYTDSGGGFIQTESLARNQEPVAINVLSTQKYAEELRFLPCHAGGGVGTCQEPFRQRPVAHEGSQEPPDRD